MTHSAPTVDGLTVTFVLNKNTMITVCGVAISANTQLVTVKVLKDGAVVEGTGDVKFDRDMEGQNEIMEFDPSENHVGVYGTFDEERKVQLVFDHGGDDSEFKEKILTDKMTSLIDEDGTTRVDMIPYDNGYTDGKEVTDSLVTVVRWSR